MSSIATALQEIRTGYVTGLDGAENRMSEWGVLEGVKADTNMSGGLVGKNIIDAYYKSTENSAFKIPVFNRSTPTIANVRSCTIPTPELTTALVTVSSTIYAWGFAVPKAIASDNLIDAQGEWDRQYKNHARSFLNDVETSIVAAFSANRSQIEGSTFTGAGAEYGDFETADEISVTKAQRDLFYNDIPSIMSGNDFYGEFNIFASSSMAARVNYIGNQGGGNSTNLAYQIPGLDHWFSNRVVPGAGNFAAGYIIPKGHTAIMERLPYDNRQGTVTTDGRVYGTAIEPFSGFEIGTVHYSKCEDLNGWQGETYTAHAASVNDYYGFNVEIGIVVPYNSAPTTAAGSIMKFVITTA